VPGLSLRLSGFHWTVDKLIVQSTDVDDPMQRQQFQNGGKLRSMGVEAEATYRDSRGWYAFGGFAYSRVGETQLDQAAGTFGDAFVYGQTANAPAVTASGGISTPKLFGRVHVSSEVMVLGERATRSDANDAASPASPAWIGWNALVYAPSIAGFDVTAGVRNILGTRDLVPAPGDYDRTIPMMTIVPRVPAEGREVYVKIGYSY
jgi:outer membrane receptor protein involved in Fe transport